MRFLLIKFVNNVCFNFLIKNFLKRLKELLNFLPIGVNMRGFTISKPPMTNDNDFSSHYSIIPF